MTIIVKNLKGGGKTLSDLLVAVLAAVFCFSSAAFASSDLLPVIPQPTEWKPGAGECALDAAKVTYLIRTDLGLGEEGYTMDIAPGAIGVVAGGETGRIWAQQTLAQLKAAGAKAQCGKIRDIPKYRVRAFMMDVGRMHHSMDFMRDLARTMSYYKMNTLHVHLNDNAGGKDPNKYAAFRLESETYPELTAKDGHYTKKEFREFQLFCKSLGVTVIPEIDVPAHSLAFTRIKPEFASKKYGADHFDLDKSAEILAWLKPLFAEYMTGAAPTFIGPYVHVGTDEYNKAEAEKFRGFIDAMFKMVKGFGYKPCAWGSLSHANGKTPVLAGRDITIDIWNNRYYHPEAALKAGYTIVSIPDKIVYLVPFGGYYNDYFDCKKMYETWEPKVNWRYVIPEKYMSQLAGGKFALWNDLCGKKKDGTPYTEADNWDRIHPAIQTFAQKMWCGARADQPWKHFAALADSLSEPEGVKSAHKAKLARNTELQMGEKPVATAKDGSNEIRLYEKPLRYEVLKGGVVVVPATKIDLKVDGKWIFGNAKAKRVKSGERRGGPVKTPVYKKSSIDAGRVETVADFGDAEVRLVARTDGVAYRFVLKKPGVVEWERANLTVPISARCWFNRTGRALLGCEETMPEFMNTVQLATDKGRAYYLPFVYSVDGKTVAVMETDLYGYPVLNYGDVEQTGDGAVLASLFAKYPKATELSQGGARKRKIAVKGEEDFIARAASRFALPWRVFALADSPDKLCETDISYALATPPAPGADFSWVKPGKVAWDWWNDFDNKGGAGCSTEGYVRFIDFAAKTGVEYVIFDEGWSANLNIWKMNPRVDVPYLIEYAKKKGVGIILWMAWAQVYGEEEKVAAHFAKMGAKGFKVDFMDRGDADVAQFLEKFAAACAKHKMLLDYHGAYRPVGLHRKYPNILSYEGIHGLEQLKWSRRNKDMPLNDVACFFLRMTAGPMDYTPGAMDNYPVGDYRGNGRNPGSIGTRCRQMALMVLYDSPLQMLCDAPTKYEKNMECFSFMVKTPVVWDAVVGLGGMPETYVSAARKAKDGSWYAAGITNRDARDFVLNTSFLGDGRWETEIFRDADNADSVPANYVHERKSVKAGDRLKFRAAKGGGFVVRFTRSQMK